MAQNGVPVRAAQYVYFPDAPVSILTDGTPCQFPTPWMQLPLGVIYKQGECRLFFRDFIERFSIGFFA
jgi:hypothetical protein